MYLRLVGGVKMKIKPLVWTDVQEPNSEICYHHIKAKTPFGDIVIDWKGWKDFPSYDISADFEKTSYIASENDLESALDSANDHWNKLICECLYVESNNE